MHCASVLFQFRKLVDKFSSSRHCAILAAGLTRVNGYAAVYSYDARLLRSNVMLRPFLKYVRIWIGLLLLLNIPLSEAESIVFWGKNFISYWEKKVVAHCICMLADSKQKSWGGQRNTA